jgi:hypothetical protein
MEKESLIEAMETLSRLAEWEEELTPEESEEEVTLWFARRGASEALERASGLFRSVLHHLQGLHNAGVLNERKELLPGLKGMMATVGEAAARLDQLVQKSYGESEHSVTGLNEYRELTRFYLDRIVKELEGSATQKQLAAALEEPLVRRASAEPDKRTGLTDMERVKADTDYELFFMTREDGSPFVTRDLVDNLKIACDFGPALQDAVGDDPLVQVQNWLDGAMRFKAGRMLRAIKPQLQAFIAEGWEETENPLSQQLAYACIALFLAANAHNLLRNLPARPCFAYFADFQTFLRDALRSPEYEALRAPTQPVKQHQLALADALCRALFEEGELNDRLPGILKELLERGHALEPEEKGSTQLESDYHALGTLLRRHPNGPLFKVLDLLRETRALHFDPLMQGNFPTQLFELNGVPILRLPTPTWQKYIDEVRIAREFRAYLEGLGRASQSHLLINLQDRASWKEGPRARALEELQEECDALTVVTLPRDDAFYHQMAPFHDDDDVRSFFTLLREQLKTESSFIPDWLLEQLDLDTLISSLHKDHFDAKQTLSRRERLDFIELFQSHLILQIIELTEPDSVSLCCKDGVDNSMGLAGALYLASGGKEKDPLWNATFLPALLIREREMQPNRFRRLSSVLRLEAGGEAGEEAR